MNSKENIRALYLYLRQYKSKLAMVFLSLLAVSFSMLGMGAVFRNLVDTGLANSDLEAINHAIINICLLVAIFALGSFCRSYFINSIALNITSRIKKDIYQNLMAMEIKNFEQLKLGDVITRITSDLDLVSNMIINFLSFFIRNIFMLFGAIVMMFLQSPKLSLMVIVIIPILLLPILRLSKRVRALSRLVLASQAAFISFIEENISGIRTIYAYNQQQRIELDFHNQLDSYMNNANQRLKFRSMFFAIAIGLITVAITSVIWVGSLDIVTGAISSGKMLSFIYYAIIAGMSAGGIAELFSEIQSPLAALERVIEIRDSSYSDASKLDNNWTEIGAVSRMSLGDIIYKNVYFSYPARTGVIILKNASFTIKQGSFAGIVGRSGSGKSTILQLLVKFFDIDSGNIMIGQHDICRVSPRSLRNNIAYIEQNPAIFSGTIRSNLLFAAPECAEEDFTNICKLCGIDDLIAEMPEGLNTQVGEKATRLSGGQKQRIAIARALLRKPDVVLLDESCSALDSISEEEIIEGITSFMKNKTVILVSHRIKALERADHIIVLEHGSVINQGTHQELSQHCPTYQELSANNSEQC